MMAATVSAPDYWLSKLFYDLHTSRSLAEAFRNDRRPVLEGYPISDETLAALARDDVGYLARLSNPFLLRYYFIAAGVPESVFLEGLRVPVAAHG